MFLARIREMIHTATQAALPLVRSSATVMVVGVCLVAAAVATLLAVGEADQIALALATGIGCIFAAVVGFIPASFLSDKHEAGVGLGFLMGTLARMSLTLAVILVVKLIVGGAVQPIAMWAIGWYLALLATEVVILQQYIAAREPQPTEQAQ